MPETLAPDTLERMGYLMGIYYGMEQIRGGERSQDWLRSPNAGNPFFGRSPLEYMLDGRMTDLVETYRPNRPSGAPSWRKKTSPGRSRF
ncbi:MAG: hypothetical protein WD766_05995 [Gemmatimonadota bacterium]